MSKFKLIDLIERGFRNSRAMYNYTTNWIKVKTDNKKTNPNKTGTQPINVTGIHERNGSRGNGIGMGHRNKLNRMK